jgi:hypothetical protein
MKLPIKLQMHRTKKSKKNKFRHYSYKVCEGCLSNLTFYKLIIVGGSFHSLDHNCF